MANIGSVVVDFLARTARFESGVDRSSQKFRKFTMKASRDARRLRNNLQGVETRMLKVATAAGLAAGTAGIAALGASSAKSIDSLAKVADRLGVTTEELNSMRLAARENSGMIDKGFDMALQRMVRRLGEAAKGTGEAKKAIAELGLDAQKLTLAGPAAAMKMIADRLMLVEDQFQRTAITQKFFDSEGVALVTTLQQGSKAFDEAAAQAERLGTNVSRIEAQKVEIMNDNVDRAKDKFRALGNQVAITASGPVTALSIAFIDSLGSADDMRTGTEKAMRFIVKSVAAVIDVYHAWKVLIVALRREVALLAIAGIDGANKLGKGYANMALKLVPALKIINLFTGTVQQDIEKLLTFDATNVVAGLKGVADDATVELTKLLGKTPGADFIAAYDVAIAKIDEMAQVALANKQPPPDPTGGIDVAGDAFQAEQEKKLETLKTFLLSSQEAEVEAFIARQEILQNALDTELLTKEQHDELAVKLAQKTSDKITEIEKRSLTARQKFEAKTGKEKAKAMFSQLAQVTSGVAQHNKTLFRINQAAGIANAIIGTAEGITQALKLGPVGIPLAAVIAAAGAAQIATIAGTSFEGGGRGTTPSLAGGGGGVAGVVNSQPVLDLEELTNGANSGPASVVIEINVESGGVIASDVDGAVEVIADALTERILNDGLIIPGNSRQAAEIREGTG